MYHEITQEISEKIEILMRDYDQAALGTITGTGPCVTKVLPLCYDGEVYFLLSDLSNHTYNINEVSNTVSVYFAGKETHKTRLNNPRLTLFGKLEKLNLDKQSETYYSLLKHFDRLDSGAIMYGMFGDFNIYKLEETDRLYVEGFGKAYK